MLRDMDSKVQLADIEDVNTCLGCNNDTNIGIAYSTRELPVREGIDFESWDRETQSSLQGYGPEEF